VGGPGRFATDLSTDGAFDFGYIPAGRYIVELEPMPVMAPLEVSVPDSDRIGVELVLPRTYRVAGRLIWENPNPLPTEVWLLSWTGRSVRIGADGSFEFPAVAPGVYRVQFNPGLPVPIGAPEVVVTDADRADLRWVVPSADSLDLVALLGSSKPLDQAWGGWLAGEMGRTTLVPLLEKTLLARVALPPESAAEAVAIDTIADTLIRLDAKVSLDTSKSLFWRRPAGALILLSRMGPEADPFLITLLDNHIELTWFAAANLLLDRRAPGVAAGLLKRLQLEASLNICNAGQICRAPRGGSFGIGEEGGEVLVGFPPWPDYQLTSGGGAGFLPAGPVPVSIVRRVSPAGRRPSGDDRTSSPSRPTAEDRLTYVRRVAPEARINLSNYEERATEWRGDEAVEAERQAFQDDIESRYTTMLGDLRAAGVLSPEEAAALAIPRLKLTVIDLRGNRAIVR
jgi:hypothetical protein